MLPVRADDPMIYIEAVFHLQGRFPNFMLPVPKPAKPIPPDK